MNWRKGFFRLWCMLSLCWVVSTGAIVWNIEKKSAERLEAHMSCVKEEREKLSGKDPDSVFDICAARSGITLKDTAFDRLTVRDTIKSYFKEYGGLTLLPPLVTLILGLLVAWVASGFKGAKQPSDLDR